ncbi:hypothetical protein BDR26DRAFT_858264 [Obelidium mucronatum]|nr:hypothetical protein BDR26DRAFT_858264 [Obelidium mucronatum]
MWEIYCEWLQGLQSGASSPSFSDYEYIRSRNRERQRKLSAAMPPASANSDDSNHHNYFPIKQSSNSIRSSATSATNTTFAIPQSPSMSPDRRSSKSAKSPRVVSFGGSSVRSFDSAESPTSVRMNTALHSLDFRNYQKEGESSSFVSSNATTQDSTAVLPVRHHHRSQSLPNSLSPSTISSLNAATPTTNTKPKIVLDVTALLPLPPHHATTLTSPTLQREESLVIKPSNDFITALLAYKSHLAATENKYRRSMSPTRVTGTGGASPIRPISPTRINSSSLTVSASAASSSTSAQITVLDPSVQIEWESALRMRVPTSDWSKLIQEVLENSISVGSQHRTYHEAKLYWDIIWRTLPLGCTLESEHRPFTPSVTTPSISSPACCPRCQNGFVETFVHFLWTLRLEWVLGSLAEGEARKARAVSLRKYGGGTRRDSELWDYGFNTEGQGNGRVSISLVDVLFCFPKVRKPNLADGTGTESPPPGPSDRYLKTVIALHATALMSLLEMRAYPGEDESLVWSFFVARYEARREVEFEQRTVSLN